MTATYFPMPWLLSTSGYGVLVENLETSYFRLGTDRPVTLGASRRTPRSSASSSSPVRPRPTPSAG